MERNFRNLQNVSLRKGKENPYQKYHPKQGNSGSIQFKFRNGIWGSVWTHLLSNVLVLQPAQYEDRNINYKS